MHGSHIIVGVSGSIAAYKAVLLVRLLVKAGAEVQVLMTPAATQFVSPLTFSTLSKREVLTSVISEEGWNNHVELGLWADAYVIAPATANTLARLAHGICDSIVAAVYLSARCPVLFAPAMDVDMWFHPSTQANLSLLESYGNEIIPVGEGELASGLNGAGRLAEPEDIVAALSRKLSATASKASPTTEGLRLSAKRVLVTAGPTHEPIDPVRFIGNRSSGKQGLAIVAELLAQGARVELVLGPVQLSPKPHPRLQVHPVQTAEQMYEVCAAEWELCDVAILVAAVADYRPANASREKIKKSGGGEEGLTLSLVRNPDIAAALGERKEPHQRVIGFALETNDGLANAKSKLERKRLDAIVLNMHGEDESAFGGEENTVTIVTAEGHTEYGRMSKAGVATVVVELCVAE